MSPRVDRAGLYALTVLVTASAQGQDAKPLIVMGGEADHGGSLEHPWAVAAIPGMIVVLERGAPHLKLFGTDGRLRQQAARNGAGPGELREPRAMAYDPATRRLVVFDPPNGRANYYILRDTLRYETARRTALNPSAACFVNGKLYALDLHEGRIIHELVPEGSKLTITRSLGVPRSDHPLAKHEMFRMYHTMGTMYCDQPGHQILVGAMSLGTVQVVSLGAAAQRTVQLRDFLPLVYSATESSLTMAVPPGGQWDEVAGIRPGPDGFRIIAGHSDMEHKGLGDYSLYREHVLTAAGIRPNPVVSHWLEIGTESGRVICYQGSPYPTVGIFAGARCP